MSAWKAAAAAFLLFCAAGLYYVHGLQASGDEPHYLLMAQSLWREGDLDLRDNVERADFRGYVPALAPHYGWPRRDGRPYPAHGAGLPFLLAPAVGLLGRPGAVLVLSLLAALLVAETMRWARLVSPGRDDTALWAGLLLMISPVFFYSFHVYTEVPSALCAWWALRLALQGRGTAQAALAALLAASLPWLHVKMLPAAAVIAAVALWRLRGAARAVFAAVVLAMAATFLGYLHHVFGGFAPVFGIYGGASGALFTGSPLRSLVGLLVDRSYGLLPYAPTLICALAALSLLPRRPTSEALRAALALGAAIVVPALLWRQWWGGMCPPARLLVPALPLFAILAGLRREGPPVRLARALTVLAAAQTLLIVSATWHPSGRLLLNRADRPARFWEALGGRLALGDYLPALAGTAAWTVPTLVWIAALAALLVWDSRALSATAAAGSTGSPG